MKESCTKADTSNSLLGNSDLHLSSYLFVKGKPGLEGKAGSVCPRTLARAGEVSAAGPH